MHRVRMKRSLGLASFDVEVDVPAHRFLHPRPPAKERALIHRPASRPLPNKGPTGASPIDRVLINDELGRRPSRPPDHEAESRAFHHLAQALAGDPETVLQEVVEIALALCEAQSAGVSILEAGGEEGLFRWRAVAGAFAPNVMSGLPRAASPCADVIARDEILLLREPARAFPLVASLEPPIHEALLAPWSIDGEPIGTLWLLSHEPARRFDAEDARRLGRLAAFASAAWRVSLALRAAREGAADLDRRIEESTAALREGRAELNRRLRLYQTVLAAIDDFAYVFDLSGRFLFANKPVLDLLGLRLDQVVGKSFDQLPYPPELAAKLRRQAKQVIQTRARVEDETTYVDSAGRQRLYRYVFNPVFDAAGQVAGIAGVAKVVA